MLALHDSYIMCEVGSSRWDLGCELESSRWVSWVCGLVFTIGTSALMLALHDGNLIVSLAFHDGNLGVRLYLHDVLMLALHDGYIRCEIGPSYHSRKEDGTVSSLVLQCVQVETIGDAYMVVAGVPEKTKYHAHNICDMALDMVRSIGHLKDPSTGSNIQIRVGVHSGMVVAGVVGHKMPRFGLYGDTVHSASAMESNGKEMHIQLSGSTYEHLIDSPFIFERRGTITIKGNVEIETYWLTGKRDKDANAQAACPQYENQAISTTTLSPLSSVGGKGELMNPIKMRDDEATVELLPREMVISTGSLGKSMKGISTNEDSFCQGHYKESFLENAPEEMTQQQECAQCDATLEPCGDSFSASQNGAMSIKTQLCHLL
ncbi:hypothetical protein scyTo_0011412 [Scyliorhinus torazame]|uniref:Guanylate cyclase domain-containing protein n=1 Tax=Scyliorhinus torazame TaxID=75743 RepID=A0A401NM88_SCYTO|nr:hypothetical protein [Scyliorhinus torazame]